MMMTIMIMMMMTMFRPESPQRSQLKTFTMITKRRFDDDDNDDDDDDNVYTRIPTTLSTEYFYNDDKQAI